MTKYENVAVGLHAVYLVAETGRARAFVAVQEKILGVDPELDFIEIEDPPA